MAPQRIPFAGARLATLSGGASVFHPPEDPYASYRFFDDFNRPSEPLNGSTPLKGNDWTATGVSAADMVVDSGEMYQTSSPPAGYAYSNTLGDGLGDIKEVSGSFKYTSTPDFGPALAIMNTIPGDESQMVIHGEMGLTFFYLRLLNGFGDFIDPHWVIRSSNFSMVQDEVYTFKLRWNGEYFYAVLIDDNDTIIGWELAWDPLTASFAGEYFFLETLSDVIKYVGANLPLEAGPMPEVTLDTMYWDFETGVNGWEPNIFGGTVEQADGKLSISTSSNFAGGQRRLNRALQVGDKVHVSLGVDAAATGVPAVCLVDYNTGTLVNDGGYPAGFTGVDGTSRGRKQYTLTVTTASADPALFIGNTDTAALDIEFESIALVFNPPTSITPEG